MLSWFPVSSLSTSAHPAPSSPSGQTAACRLPIETLLLKGLSQLSQHKHKQLPASQRLFPLPHPICMQLPGAVGLGCSRHYKGSLSSQALLPHGLHENTGFNNLQDLLAPKGTLKPAAQLLQPCLNKRRGSQHCACLYPQLQCSVIRGILGP